jgi:hypothetical protein
MHQQAAQLVGIDRLGAEFKAGQTALGHHWIGTRIGVGRRRELSLELLGADGEIVIAVRTLVGLLPVIAAYAY